MKYLLCGWVILVYACGANASLEFMQAVRTNCKVKEGAADIDELEFLKDQVPRSAKGACFRACVLERLKILLPNKILNKTRLQDIARNTFADREQHDRVMKVIDYCTSNQSREENRCEIALRFTKCWNQKAQELEILPDKDVSTVEKCRKQLNGSASDELEVLKGRIPVTNTSACIYACYYKNNGEMDSKNRFLSNKLKENYLGMKDVNPEEYEKYILAIDYCTEEPSHEDECSAAKQFVICTTLKEIELGLYQD